MGNVAREFEEVLRRAESERLNDVWGLHAAQLAHGISKSGVPSLLRGVKEAVNDQATVTRVGLAAVGTETREVRDAVMALAAVNAAGFDSICLELGQQNNLLGNIENLLANPLSVSAAERYRRGVHALTQGWPDLALGELDASIEQDPFQAIAHFSRGMALGALGRETEAIAAFTGAVRFTGTDRNLDPVAVGAAILASQALDRAGDRAEAVALASQVRAKVGDRYPELLLILSRVQVDPGLLREAVQMAPELSVAAVAGEMPEAREVSQSVYADPSGPIQSMIRAVRLASEVGHRVDLPTSPPEVMSFHRTWSTELAESTRQAADSVLRQAADIQAKARESQETAMSARSRRTRVFAFGDLLMCALGVVGMLVGYVVLHKGLFWYDSYFKGDNTEHPGLGLLSLPAIFAGGAVILFSFVFTVSGANEVFKAAGRADDSRRATRVSQSAAEKANTAAKSAAHRATVAREILGLVSDSVPERLHPLTPSEHVGQRD